MAKRKEIKFRQSHGGLVGKQNGLTFCIHEDRELAATCAPAHYVVIDPTMPTLERSMACVASISPHLWRRSRWASDLGTAGRPIGNYIDVLKQATYQNQIQSPRT